MSLILDDKQPIILVPDNSPITALSAIGNLNWLLVPGVPVKAIVLVDERRARKALSTLDANLDIISTRAFFKVLTTDYGLNGTSGYWHLVLSMIGDMDPLDEVLKIRVEGGAPEKQRKR
jgi:hypothetical protein